MISKLFYHDRKMKDFGTGGARQIYTYFDFLERQNVAVEYLQDQIRPSAFVRYNPILSNLWYICFCFKRVSQKECVLAIDYAGRVYTVLFACFVRLFSRTKIVITMQGTYFASRRSKVKNLLDLFVSIVFLKTAHQIITSGPSLNRQIVRWGIAEDAIRAIHPALRPEFVQPGFTRQAERPNGPSRLLLIGRLDPVKGVEYLIEAAARLRPGSFRITIVGSLEILPDYTQRVKNLMETYGLNDSISLEGNIADIEVLIKHYRSADVFVLPSVWDTSPIALVEAMCFSLPIIATNVGGVPDLVEGGVNGILVPPKDAKALAAAIQKLIDEPGLASRMGKESFERSILFQGRTWDDAGKEYYEALTDLAGHETR